MKIIRISLWQFELPLNEPYSLSGGRLKYDRLETTFVKIDTDDGLVGWGESCPWGHTYLPAHSPGVIAALGIIGPALIGIDARAIDSVERIMDRVLPGHEYAKSAIDLACWDILGKATGLPLYMLLGGDIAEPIELNSSIATGSPEEMVLRIASASLKGYRTHSAKVGGSEVATDIERIETIEASLPVSNKVTFDVNRAWLPGVAISVLNATRTSCWVEQPCQTLEQCAHVARRVASPIMLDECLQTYQDHLDAQRYGVFEGIKIKPNRLGGLTKARRIRDLALQVGWQMHIEDVGGTALADTAALHLAASTPKDFRLASWICSDHLAVDPIVGQGARNLQGFAELKTTPGIGVIPDENLLGQSIAIYL